MVEPNGFSVHSKELELSYKSHLDEQDLIDFLRDVMGRITSYSVSHSSKKHYGREYPCTNVRVSLHELFVHEDAVSALTYHGIRPFVKSMKRREVQYNPDTSEVGLLEGCWNGIVKLFEQSQASPPRVRHRPESRESVHHVIRKPTRRQQPEPGSSRDVVESSSSRDAVEPMKWQQDLLDELQKLEPKGKACGTIVWYWDGEGGCGKSTVVRMISQKYGTDVVILTSGNREGDVAQVLVAATEKNKRLPPRVVVDLPASCAGTPNLYSSLNSISNGTITATKYHSDTLIFDVSHVVVLASFLPDTSSMSAGRIEVRELKRKGNGTIGCWKRTEEDLPALRDLEQKYIVERAARTTVKKELCYD